MQALTTQAIAPAPLTAPPVQPIQSVNSPPSNPRLSLPEKYDGSSAKCKGLLFQCSLFINQQPNLYPMEDS